MTPEDQDRKEKWKLLMLFWNSWQIFYFGSHVFIGY